MRSILWNVGWTFRNLFAGLRLTLPIRVGRQSFHFSSDQALTLLLVSCGATLLSTYFMSGSGARLGWYSWSLLAARCFFGLLLIYLVARLQGALDMLPAMIVALCSASCFLDLYQALLYRIGWKYGIGFSWLGGATTLSFVLWGLVLVWVSAATLRAMRLIYASSWVRSGLLSALMVIGGVGVSWVAPAHFWYVPRAEAEDDSRAPAVDTERTYYAQPGLMAKTLSALAPSRRGLGELYFLGFAGTSDEDVFMKEVRVAKTLFDDRFDTRRRSLILVNNPETVEELPVASVSNLELALGGIAKRMDVDKDILFLYLTSHGSRHVFSVSFPELALGDLGDRQLKAMLDRSGIKWRVLVISACYSGSFIDALKDNHTLIVTAASKDRTSFGCGSESEFTYFGDAYINTALRDDRSFIAAFYHARDTVAAREKEEALTPSEPQIYVGAAMQAKLQQLERRLTKVAAARQSPPLAAAEPRGAASRFLLEEEASWRKDPNPGR
jgi:hypothetical protein